MLPKTNNFNIETDPKLACTCGKSDCTKKVVKQSTLTRLQKVRDDALRPLTVTSGGRCSKHPNEIKRTKPADHQKGIAVDISVAGGLERAQIVRLGMKHGFNAVGVAKTFVHLGYREGEPFVMWVY